MLAATSKFLRQIVPPVHRNADRRRADRRVQPRLHDPSDAAAHGRAALAKPTPNRRRRAPRPPPRQPWRISWTARPSSSRRRCAKAEGRHARSQRRISPALKHRRGGAGRAAGSRVTRTEPRRPNRDRSSRRSRPPVEAVRSDAAAACDRAPCGAAGGHVAAAGRDGAAGCGTVVVAAPVAVAAPTPGSRVRRWSPPSRRW